MTKPAEKGPPKEEKADIPRIGKNPAPKSSREKILHWLTNHAAILGLAGVVITTIIGMNTLLWYTTSARFDDTAKRIDDTKAEVQNVEKRLTDQIKDTKAEAGKIEARLGKRIDEVRTEIRDTSQDSKSDRNSLRQDIQGLRQDISTMR